MKKRLVKAATLAMLALTGGSMDAWAADGEPDKQVQQIAAKIDETEAQIANLQRQKEELEQQRQEAERLAELRAELAELRQESQERIADANAQLVEIEKEIYSNTMAQLALAEGKRKFLNSRKALDTQILGIDTPEAIDQAKELQRKIAELETEWSLVLEPQFNAAIAIDEMEKSLARESASQPRKQELLKKLKLLAEQDAAGRRQELASIKSRNEREATWAKLVEAFDKAE